MSAVNLRLMKENMHWNQTVIVKFIHVLLKSFMILNAWHCMILRTFKKGAAFLVQNRFLQEQNKRLQKQTTNLAEENADLRIRLGLTPPVSPDTQTEPFSPLSSVPSPSGSEDSECSVVIKKETEYEEYASLLVSQQQEHLILFLSVVTTFLTVNSRWAIFQIFMKFTFYWKIPVGVKWIAC